MKDKIEVDREIMEGLFRIMSNISGSFSGYEVYNEAKPGMEKAREFILTWGDENNIDLRGYNLKY